MERGWRARQAVPTPIPSCCEMVCHEAPEARRLATWRATATGGSPAPWAFSGINPLKISKAVLDECVGLLTGQSVPVFVNCQTRYDSLPDLPFSSRVVSEHRICTCSWRAPGHFVEAALSKQHGRARSQQHCSTWAVTSSDLVLGRTMIRSARILRNQLKYNIPT